MRSTARAYSPRRCGPILPLRLARLTPTDRSRQKSYSASSSSILQNLIFGTQVYTPSLTLWRCWSASAKASLLDKPIALGDNESGHLPSAQQLLEDCRH